MNTSDREKTIKIIEQIKNLCYENDVNLPLERREKPFKNFLQDFLENFKILINNKEYNNLLTEMQKDKLERLCDCIINCVNYYYVGKLSRAYEKLSIGIDNISEYLDNLNSNFDEESGEVLYRMRVGTNHPYSREEIFHIPFELRGKVSTQRYSIPGLPSLYLGSSLYICWEELNRPNFDNIQVARFKISSDKSIKYIDFGYPPRVLAFLLNRELVGGKSSQEELIKLSTLGISYLMCLPLIAACSIKVKNREDVFKPEYIVPQLLLQWVMEHFSYNGIRYFSVSTNCNKKSYYLFHNYVFPVVTNQEKGLCSELGRLFEISEPISWQYAKVLTSNERFNLKETSKSGNLLLNSRAEVKYNETEFAAIEKIIDNGEMVSVSLVDNKDSITSN